MCNKVFGPNQYFLHFKSQGTISIKKSEREKHMDQTMDGIQQDIFWKKQTYV